MPDTVRPWAARPWWIAPACLTAVLLLDTWLAQTSYLLRGLVDEPAHLLTTSIAVLAVIAARGGRVAPAFAVAALAAGNLVDADHLPQVLGSDVLTRGTPRPYPHSLAAIALLLVVATAARGRTAVILRGVAFGVAVHLVRDLGTAPVALLWPVSSRGSSCSTGPTPARSWPSRRWPRSRPCTLVALARQPGLLGHPGQVDERAEWAG